MTSKPTTKSTTALPVIAIDGTAASGKGTLCRRLGEELHMAVLDTGKLYRLVGHKCLENNIDPEDEAAVTKLAESLKDHLNLDDLTNPALQSDEAGQMASKTGQYKGVRQALLDFQHYFAANPPEIKDFGPAKGAILDGRDIGTIIIPDAPCKLFVTASLEIRAQRRYKELHSIDNSVTHGSVFEDMKARDARDASRSSAPMIAAEDAILLDTSDMDIDEVYNKALAVIKDKLDI